MLSEDHQLLRTSSILLFCMFLAGVISHAQETDSIRFPLNTIYVEGAGHGGAYALGYERAVSPTVSLMGGASLYALGDLFSKTSTHTLAVPLNCVLYFSDHQHRMYADAGATLVVSGRKSYEMLAIIPNVGVGYQFRPFQGRMMIKGGLIMGTLSEYDIPLFFWPSVAVGYSF